MNTHPPGWPVIPLALGGRRAFVSTGGHGPPLVLLPSLFALPRTYRPVAEALARRFRVYLPEVPGSGRSARLRRPWSLDEYAAWVGTLLEVLNLHDVTLVGHSHAGAVAVSAAAACPERIARVVLVDAVGSGRRSRPLAVVGGGFQDIILDFDLVAHAWPDVVFNVVRHPRTFYHHLRLCFTTDLLPLARTLAAPVLVAWGRRDHTIPLTFARRFANAIPHSRVYVSRGGSHNWLITRPDEFVTALVAAFGDPARTPDTGSTALVGERP